MQIAIHDSQIGLRNSVTRIPFRYGKACLTRCPQLMIHVTAQFEGTTAVGAAADCLPPGWFDKRPGRRYRQQIDQMLEFIQLAERCFRKAFQQPAEFMPTWRSCYDQIHAEAETRDATALLASFAVSLFERAMLDSVCRGLGKSFHAALRDNAWGIDGDPIWAEFGADPPAAWLPSHPLDRVFARHTIGLADPLTDADLAESREGAPDDGLPVVLEDYIRRGGLRYFKIKVSNQLSADMTRLRTIATLIETVRGDDYRVTLDGNEQYSTIDEILALVESIRGDRSLRAMWDNVLVIEQPVERDHALDPGMAQSLRDLGRLKPVIIDESDGTLESFAKAVELGYRGTSMKNCKGPLKAILNRGLIAKYNRSETERPFVMTAEDLCSVGVVAVQSDLCLAASLGIEHVERNGHHFHSGLSYLPIQLQQQALHDHPDFYAQHSFYVGPNLDDGCFRIGSFHAPGFGFRTVPDMASFTPLHDWTFDSLGLDE